MVVIKQAKKRVKKEKNKDLLMDLLEKIKNPIPYGLECHKYIKLDDKYAVRVKQNYLRYGSKGNTEEWIKHKKEVVIPYVKQFGRLDIVRDLEVL